MRLSVVTYNVKFCELIFDHDLNELVTELDADILCVQEFPADAFTLWREALNRNRKCFGFLTKTSETVLGVEQTNVVFSRYPILDFKSIDLTLDKHEPRFAQLCMIELEGESVAIVNTHLGLNNHERQRQVRSILNLCESLQARGCHRLIFAGDLNDWNRAAHKKISQYFSESYYSLHQKLPRTFSSRISVLELDRIYFHGIKLLDSKIIKTPLTKKSSDHLALKSIFAL